MECWFSQMYTTSVLAHHWIKKIIKTLFLILFHVPTKREGEFGLHLYVCKQMMPYDFATGNLKYTRYGVSYINYMEK